MKLQLDNEIYKWLLSLNIITPSPKYKLLSSGKYELDEQTSQIFENGLKFVDLIKCLFPLVMEETSQNPLKTLQSLKDQNTPASRLYNWNILYEILKKMGVNLDPEIKSLLVKGDLPMLNEFLKEIYENISNRLERLSATSSAKSNISTRNYDFLLKMPKKGITPHETDINNIEKIQKDLPINECRSLLEILLVSLTRNLDLKPKQAIALLSNGNKYLAHVLVKGIKGNYDPLVLWLQELYTNIQYFLPFLIQEDLLIPVILQAVKPALLSKSFEISSWGCRIISHLCYELANLELLAPAWEWFCKENGGFNACFLCIRRNLYMREGVVSVLSQIARFNLAELLTVEVRKLIENPLDLLDFLHNILNPLVESSLIKEGIMKEGVLDCWIDLAFKTIEGFSENKTIALNLLVEIWIIYPNYIEETENLAGNLLIALKKGTREKAVNLRVSSIILLFKLLEFLAKCKNPYAPIIYKTLTFSFIENHAEIVIREVYCRNFMNIIQVFPSIPVDILVDPLIKQIQVSENTTFFINIFDFDLLFIISKHPKLQVKMAILLIDLLAKIYLNSLIWSSLSIKIIRILLDRFIETPVFQQFLQKMFEVLIETFRISERKRKFPLKNPMIFSEESEVEVQNAQQRGLIIEILKEILEKQCISFNNFAKTPILTLFLTIKQARKTEHKGLLTILKLLGNPHLEIPLENHAKDIGIQIDISNENPPFSSKELINNTSGNSMLNIEKFEQKSEKNQQKSSFFENDEIFFEKDQLFMEKNRIGIKEKKGGSESKSRILMKNKPNIRVIEDLERLRVKKLEEILKKQIEEEERKIKDEILKKTLKKKLEKLGVFKSEKPTILGKTEENEVYFSENPDKKPEICDVFLIDWDNEEEKDREIMGFSLKKGLKIMRYLFKKYSNSTNLSKKPEFFTEMKRKFETITNHDIWRMLKDFCFEAYCTKDQVFQLAKLVNISVLKRNDGKNLDFDGFVKFFNQFSMNFFQGDLDYFFREIEKNCKEIKGFYIENDDIETQEINRILKEKPDAEIPDSFKKIYEKNTDFRYNLPFELSRQINDSYLISHAIIDEILKENLEIHLNEPFAHFSMITKAKRKPRDLSMNKRENPLQKSETVMGKGQINALRRIKSKNIDEKGEISKENTEEKRELSKENTEEKREISKENIENIRSQSQGLQRKRSISGKNRIEEEKNKLRFLEEMKKKDAEIKRKQRQEEVELKLKQLKERKKEEEDQKLQEFNKKFQEKEELEKKEIEKKRKRFEENKKKLKEFKEKQENDKNRLENVEKIELEKKQEAKKKETDEFLKKQTEKLKQNFEGKKNERSLEMRKKQEIEENDKIKEIDRKKQISLTLEKERLKREKEKKFRQEIKELQNKDEISSVFKKNNEELTSIYSYYIENTELSLDVPYVKENLQFKGFMNFAVEFQLIPAILSIEKMQLLYRATTKDKQLADKVPIGLNFSEFQQILLRIAIKGKKWFDFIGNNRENTDKKAEEEVKEEIISWNHEEFSAFDKEKVDEYEKIQETDRKTVEGLMKYLDFPIDKAKLNNKLKDLKTKHDKVMAPRDKKKAFASKLSEKKREKSTDLPEKLRNNENKQQKKEKKEKKGKKG